MEWPRQLAIDEFFFPGLRGASFFSLLSLRFFAYLTESMIISVSV